MNEKLDEFELNIGLPENVLPGSREEFRSYLNMDITVLEKLSQQQCANIAYRLVQFSVYIQRCLNREKAKSKTLTKKIDSIIGPKINQYSGPWNLQRASAILDDDAAKALNSEIIESEARQERLEFVASGIKNLADQMKSIQFAKREV